MNKASGGDGIPAELFQILNDDAVKVLYSICQQIWKTYQLPQNWRRSVFIPIPKKANAKECANYCMIAFTSHGSRVMLKILQSRLQRTSRCISRVSKRQSSQRSNCQHLLDHEKSKGVPGKHQLLLH